MKTAIRADGGAAIGLGHWRRCQQVAQALMDEGCNSVLVTRTEPPPDLSGPWSVLAIPPDVEPAAEPEWVASIAVRQGCAAVLVDHYAWDSARIAALGRRNLYVARMDDGQLPSAPGHLVINGSAAAGEAGYAPIGPQRLLLGPRFLPLAPVYAAAPARPEAGAVRQVLLTLGGADPGSLTPHLVRTLLQRLPMDVVLDTVVGPFFGAECRMQLASAAGQAPGRVRIIDAPPTLHPLLARADLAIIAGGGTVYEAAATGCPAVAVGVAGNQRPNLIAMARAGALVHAGWADEDAFPDRVAALAAELAADPGRRAGMALAGQALVDGQGAWRIAMELIQGVKEGLVVAHSAGR